jgi:hypothetical protein
MPAVATITYVHAVATVGLSFTSANKNFTESLSVNEAILLGFTKPFTEALTASDSISVSLGKIVAESVRAFELTDPSEGPINSKALNTFYPLGGGPIIAPTSSVEVSLN